jgi:hypothetical protein
MLTPAAMHDTIQAFLLRKPRAVTKRMRIAVVRRSIRAAHIDTDPSHRTPQ